MRPNGLEFGVHGETENLVKAFVSQSFSNIFAFLRRFCRFFHPLNFCTGGNLLKNFLSSKYRICSSRQKCRCPRCRRCFTSCTLHGERPVKKMFGIRVIPSVQQKYTAKYTEQPLDNDLEEADFNIVRYRPESLDTLCETTKFSRKELQVYVSGLQAGLSLRDRKRRSVRRHLCTIFSTRRFW